MNTPTMVLKYPGPHQLQDGYYDWKIVDAEDVEAAVADGWFRTKEEAKAAAEATKVDVVSAPTRAELEQKATELGLKFDGRTSDKKLSDLIAASLEA